MNLTRLRGGDHSVDHDGRTYYVLGGGHLGVAVARRLLADSDSVTLVDELSPGEHRGLPETAVVHGDPADTAVLEEAGLGNDSTVIVATQSDSRNLLIAQLVRTTFDDPNIVVLTNVPDRFDLIEQAGHVPVCATSVLSDALVDNA
ncbi:MAG: NAD(P)-binding protein [Halolamina sp.]|uniref:NAD(P)-binding protein n=1 Tax=Halolamina sp. TaxID=1940283 RepID=UPI002FC30558